MNKKWITPKTKKREGRQREEGVKKTRKTRKMQPLRSGQSVMAGRGGADDATMAGFHDKNSRVVGTWKVLRTRAVARGIPSGSFGPKIGRIWGENGATSAVQKEIKFPFSSPLFFLFPLPLPLLLLFVVYSKDNRWRE